MVKFKLTSTENCILMKEIKITIISAEQVYFDFKNMKRLESLGNPLS
jgi:hypothetical protein